MDRLVVRVEVRLPRTWRCYIWAAQVARLFGIEVDAQRIAAAIARKIRVRLVFDRARALAGEGGSNP